MAAKNRRKKNPHAVALGSRGGKARVAKLTAQQLSDAAKIAVAAREERKRKGDS